MDYLSFSFFLKFQVFTAIPFLQNSFFFLTLFLSFIQHPFIPPSVTSIPFYSLLFYNLVSLPLSLFLSLSLPYTATSCRH